ncbi:GlxA family transcriptional regulator [Peijinzhouia sedimentorum]
MKHISILVPHYVNLAGFENPRQGLQETNELLISKGRAPIFDINIVGENKEMKSYDGQISIWVDRLISEIDKTDLIIIPPVHNVIAEALKANHRLYPWICEQRQKGAHIVSLCLGTFLLAKTGLLDNKKCVTHWRAGDSFRRLFPKAILLSDKILTDEDGIYTGGGAFSSANLILYLIEKLVDRETAIYCSKIFQIDVGRNSQSPFIIFSAQKNHNDEQVIKAQNFIEQNYFSKISVDDLCDYSGIGRRTFERRFKKATANTVIEYVQRTRIEVAKKEFELGVKTLNEIMYDVGYNDPKAFRNVFKRVTGLYPVDYKERFN